MSRKKTGRLKLDAQSPDPKIITRAASILKSGGVIIFPTETVYGLGSLYGNEEARRRIYQIKARLVDKPLQVLIASETGLADFGVKVSPEAREVINKFTPGALTFILESAAGEKIGFRIPAAGVIRALLEEIGSPIEATSANRSGEKAPASADEVSEEILAKVDLFLDSGRCAGGRESTVVDLSVWPPKVLREGAISKREIGEE